MTLKVTANEACTIAELSGNVTFGASLRTIEQHLKKLADEGARKIVVDVANLAYIDSAGIGMLVSCFGHIVKLGGTMRIAGARGPVAKVFEVVHLDGIVPLDPDVETACRV